MSTVLIDPNAKSVVRVNPTTPPDRSVQLEAFELDYLRLYASGLAIGRIARELGVSARTLHRRVHEMCDRFGVQTPVQMVAIAARAQLL